MTNFFNSLLQPKQIYNSSNITTEWSNSIGIEKKCKCYFDAF